MQRINQAALLVVLLGTLACAQLVGPSAEELAATYVAQTQAAASPTPAATDTPVPPTATITPPPPTPTNTPKPKPSPTLGPITVRDDFSRNTGIWDCEVCSWRDGALVLGPWPASGAYQQQNAVCFLCGEVRHFRMGVDVTFGSGQSDRGFGLLVKWSEAVLVTAEVTTWQTVDGWKYDYEKQLWDWLNGTYSGGVRPGRATNRLEVEVAPATVAGKTTMTYTVNGRNLVILYNQTGEPGFVGLTLFGHAVEVIFDNFEFEELPPYSGWQPPGPPGPTGLNIGPGEPIHIAWIQTISGATGFLGQTNVNGAQLAFDGINNEVLGHPILFSGEDSFCTAEGGQAAARKVAADPTVVAVIGTTCSSAARTAMPLISDADLTMISPSNTNPDLTNPDHPDHHVGYFRTAHNDLFQARLAAGFGYEELGLRSAVTIHDGSPYAKSLADAFAENFEELGGKVTRRTEVNVGQTDMRPVLTAIAADPPDLIYFPVFEPEGDLIAAQKCKVAGLEDTILLAADGLLTEAFPEAAGQCAVAMYLSGPFVSGPEYEAWLREYIGKYGQPPEAGFGPHAYDAARIIIAAIQQVAIVDGDGTVHIDRQALREAIYATADFHGLTGSLTCDANGDCATGEALAVFQITAAMVSGTEDLLTSRPVWIRGG